jgi:hypothetical protein
MNSYNLWHSFARLTNSLPKCYKTYFTLFLSNFEKLERKATRASTEPRVIDSFLKESYTMAKVYDR